MKKIIKVIIIISIFLIIMGMCFNWYMENQIAEPIKETEVYSITENVVATNEIEKEEIKRETKEGYEIIASLEIPKINLKTDVLAESNKETLLVSVTRFWGAKPNQIGNFCIAGHNYKRNNMFYHLKELKKDDEVILTDNTNTSIKYKVYSITRVAPSDIACLSQETNGKREITLITCTSDSKKRIIVKAREIDTVM